MSPAPAGIGDGVGRAGRCAGRGQATAGVAELDRSTRHLARFEVALSAAMWMHGRYRADSPQGVGCVTSARFHDRATLANTLVRIRALPDPLRGIGSVSLASTTRILENGRAVGTLCDYVCASNTCNFQGVVQKLQVSATSKLARRANKNVSNHPARSITQASVGFGIAWVSFVGGRCTCRFIQILR